MPLPKQTKYDLLTLFITLFRIRNVKDIVLTTGVVVSITLLYVNSI